MPFSKQCRAEIEADVRLILKEPSSTSLAKNKDEFIQFLNFFMQRSDKISISDVYKVKFNKLNQYVMNGFDKYYKDKLFQVNRDPMTGLAEKNFIASKAALSNSEQLAEARNEFQSVIMNLIATLYNKFANAKHSRAAVLLKLGLHSGYDSMDYKIPSPDLSTLEDSKKTSDSLYPPLVSKDVFAKKSCSNL